jgi:hypothetical protein
MAYLYSLFSLLPNLPARLLDEHKFTPMLAGCNPPNSFERRMFLRLSCRGSVTYPLYTGCTPTRLLAPARWTFGATPRNGV